MDITPPSFEKSPFEPPAPVPRTVPPGRLEIIRTVLKNPLELWGEPSYSQPWIDVNFFGRRTIIANDPALIKHVLVDNVANYKMSEIRQLVLRPILRDGLLTAEGEIWKRSRKAMAPVFTPRHAWGFADRMLRKSQEFASRYQDMGETGTVVDIATDMTALTFEILSETLFSGDIAAATADFAGDVDALLHRMGRVDPMDLLEAPAWVPRLTRMGGQKVLAKFRKIVTQTMDLRRQRMARQESDLPQDFLSLLLALDGPDGLTQDEIEDNILTFIGAGHETTARALAWTLYCVANTPLFRDKMEAEIDTVLASRAPPVSWLEQMPHVRAAFEEALRLYPPAPSINRQAVADDTWTSADGQEIRITKGTTVLVMPWTLHRHTLYWDRPRCFMPERFLPENRNAIGRFQFLPFGAGPRICIGATFALQEAVIALAALMQSYRFDMTDKTHPWPVQKLTTQPADGLPLRVSRRQRVGSS